MGVRERRRIELAQKIELTALELFAAAGFEDVTGDDIATAVGISRRTVFRYFPGGKEEIVLRDLRRRMAQLRVDVEQRPPDEMPLAALRSALLRLADGYEGDHDMAAMRGGSWSGLRVRRRGMSGEQVALTAAIVHTIAVRMGVDPAVDPRPQLMVATSLGAVQVGFRMWIRSGGRLGPRVKQCLDIIDCGLDRAQQRPAPPIVG